MSRSMRVFMAAFLCVAGASRAASPSAGVEGFYIGTYTTEASGSTSKGIYQASLDLGAGTFSSTNLDITIPDASFEAMHPSHKYLYAVSETGNYVAAYSINPTTKNLTYLNQISTGGAPVNLVVDAAGTSLLEANYNGGSVEVLSIQANGSLGSTTASNEFGSSAESHCVVLDASNLFAFVCCKGLDKIYSFQFNSALGTLTANNPPSTATATGAGPRHLTFDSQNLHAYVICELNSTVISFNYNASTGVITPFQTNNNLPAGRVSGNNAGAEIMIHPSGKFLYGSNRANNSSGTNTIAVYTINTATGALTQVQQAPTGATPRNFALDPTGAYCIVANQGSNSVALYSINPATGLLTQLSQTIVLSAPVCVLPFFTQPPQPVLGVSPASNGSLQVGVGNGCGVLGYQLFQASALTSSPSWNMLAAGATGQTNFCLTNFVLTNTRPQAFFRVSVTNY